MLVKSFVGICTVVVICLTRTTSWEQAKMISFGGSGSSLIKHIFHALHTRTGFDRLRCCGLAYCDCGHGFWCNRPTNVIAADASTYLAVLIANSTNTVICQAFAGGFYRSHADQTYYEQRTYDHCSKKPLNVASSLKYNRISLNSVCQAQRVVATI